MSANVIPFARRRRSATAAADPRPAVAVPKRAAGRVELPPNGTELTAADLYAAGFYTLRQYVTIIGGDDQRRAGYVLERYLAGDR